MNLLVRGYGFDGFGMTDANITIGDLLIDEGISVTALTSGVNIILPSLPTGTYVVTVVTENGLSAQTTITITKTSTVTVSPASAARTSTITISGLNFRAVEDTTVYIKIINATTRSVVNSFNTVTNGTGYFKTTFDVPANYKLGNYLVNVTDAAGLTDDVTLSITTLDLTEATGAE
jgi:hypothetical protein